MGFNFDTLNLLTPLVDCKAFVTLLLQPPQVIPVTIIISVSMLNHFLNEINGINF